MTTSPERCLGGLIKDIDKELSPRDFDFDSKDETDYKTSSEKKLSLDSIYSFTSSTSFFSPLSEDNKFSSQNKFSPIIFNKSTILSAFNNQRNTIILQKSLMEASKETIDNIIKEMAGIYSKIIKNKNGNYFCSDLFKVCDKNQRIIILKEICNSISDDCVDEYGTHPIQTLVELSECEEEYKLILSSFNENNKILDASLNPNGSFVIQKIIVHIPERYRMEFNLKFIKYLCILSMDMYGVCTVKKFIGYTKNELLIKQILNIILNNFVNISENQYGNYLIQFILEDWWNKNEGIFLKKLCISKFHILASNHFSSYICDLFIKLSNYEEKKILMSSLIKDKTLTLLINNNSGNIIINKLMNSLKNQQDGNNGKKKYIPLSLNNIKTFSLKNKNEKNNL
jgi:phosphoribosylformylglycinamidine (FGAM) synthase-like amidotransferase family enzyme